MPTETQTETPFTTRGLPDGLRKLHNWASRLPKDANGRVRICGPINGADSPWNDKLLTKDRIYLTVWYNPDTGMLDIDVIGSNATDISPVRLEDGREIVSATYPTWNDSCSIRQLPTGAKAFLMRHMN